MNNINGKRNRKILIWAVSVALAILLIFGGCALYLGDYYRADIDRINSFVAEIEVERKDMGEGIIAFEPSGAEAGFIFYPGGKIEAEAYIPLMACLASKGVVTVLVEMPFNLAVLDINAASGICGNFPEIESWYIGGHSLGGSMAASYVSEHTDDFEGLVLLGAYSTADISDTDLRVLSLYGSEDGVMNRKKYEEYRSNLPVDLVETLLDGGNHAYFGMYGEQDGDGAASISDEEQIKLTADRIWELIHNENRE